MLWRYLLLMFGVFTGATAVIMIRQCSVNPSLLASYRQAVAAVVLLPLFLRDWRRHRSTFGWRQMGMTVLPGLFLGAHFITWIIGARMTPPANSSLVVNMVPVAMPFLAYFLIREPLRLGEYAGTALAMAGVAVLTIQDFHLDRQSFLGDLVCFGSMLLFAAYIALARRNRESIISLWLYVVPLYAVGALACLAAALPQTSPLAVDGWWNWLMILGLGIIPTVMGHSILNYSMKHLRSQVVSIANLSQFIYAGIMGYFVERAVPGWAFYPASLLLIAGSVLALKSQPQAGTEQLAQDEAQAP